MLRRVAVASALLFSVSCNKASEDGPAPVAGSAAKPAPSGAGFSADLAKDLDPGKATGSGAKAEDGKTGEAGKPGEPKPDEAKAGETKAGEPKPDEAKAGETKAGETKAGELKAGEAKAGESKVGETTTGEANAGGTKAGELKAGEAKAGEANTGGKAGEAKPREAPPPSEPVRAAGVTRIEPRPASASTPPVAPGAHGPVKVSGDLAAIKLSLLPNWDRDIDEAGTFQYVVRIKGTQSTKTFSFRYGYDDPRAPTDRDQYKKYLQETNAMTGEIKDRQRGSAWFLEGNDASGPAFRYVVLYGGKRLICYGSLYRDADSNRLGDDRDQTVIQAKQICETLAL
jgi:hypothetical protein